jgi:spore germination protein GerM
MIATVAIAIAGLTWLERRSQAPVLQPALVPSASIQPAAEVAPTPANANNKPAVSATNPTPTGQVTSPAAANATANPAAKSTAAATANPLPSAAPGPATYWVDDRNNRIAFSRQAIAVPKSAQDPESLLRQAIEALLANRTESSSIPVNTRLRSLKMRDRRNIYIDLSQEFVGGGGTASMSARVGQVLLTATSLDPTAQVWLSVEGNLLTELGGEGIEIPQPLTKAAFEKNFGL